MQATDDLQRVRSLIMASGLVFSDKMLSWIRPSVRLHLTTDDGRKRTKVRSFLGGTPFLLPDLAWPTYAGRPMPFIGQLDVAHIKQLVPDAPLPAQGMLLFFYQQDIVEYDITQGYAVYYLADSSISKERPFPEGFEDEEQFVPCLVEMRLEYTIPSLESMFLLNQDISFDHAYDPHNLEEATIREAIEHYLALHQAIERPYQSESAHRCLGYPDLVQGDMERECDSAFTRRAERWQFGDLRTTEEAIQHEQSERWQLLLQVDTDDQFGTEWGDTGRIYFWLNTDSLDTLSSLTDWTATTLAILQSS